MQLSRDPSKSRPLSANVKRLMTLERAAPKNSSVIKLSRGSQARDPVYCHKQAGVFMEAASMGLSMEEFAPKFMNSQLAGVFDVSFSAAAGIENDSLSAFLQIPILLKSPETVVETLYWIDDIISKAEEGENKSLLVSRAYENEQLSLPAQLAALPAEPNRDVNALAYAYWLGYIYRYECLMHEESSRMVYGAFDEETMKKAYAQMQAGPLGQGNLEENAPEICAQLDRTLIEDIWPARKKKREQMQAKESKRHKKKNQKQQDDPTDKKGQEGG